MHYQNNKESKRNYYESNKDKIKDQKNIKHSCDCGGSFTNSNNITHQKTKIHQNYINTLLVRNKPVESAEECDI